MLTGPAVVVRSAIVDPERAPAKMLTASESIGAEDIFLYRPHYTGIAKLSGISDRHLLFVHVGFPVPAECRIGNAELNHCVETGNITVIPANTEWNAVVGEGAEGVVVAIPKTRLAVAAAHSVGSAVIIEPKLRSKDPVLLSIIRDMTINYQSGRMDRGAWHTAVDELADHLALSYSAPGAKQGRGRLAPETMARINDYLERRLDQSLAIDDVADVAKQTRSNFPRVFRRTIGMSPHQYIMRLRLRRARRLMEQGCPLAEVAVATGFSDQSHLTNWLRRIYGTTPGRLFAHR